MKNNISVRFLKVYSRKNADSILKSYFLKKYTVNVLRITKNDSNVTICYYCYGQRIHKHKFLKKCQYFSEYRV